MDVFVTLSIAVIIFVGILAYIIKLRLIGYQSFERIEQQGGSRLVSKSIMEMGYWWFQPMGEYLIRRNFTPNQISWTSLGCGFIAGLYLCFGLFGFAATFLLLSAILDALDGYVANKTNQTSASGEILDSSLDRYVDFFILAGLLIFYRESLTLTVLILFALLGSFMISYSSAKAQALNVKPPRGSMKRSDRLVYLISGAYFTSLSIAFIEGPIDQGGLGFPMILVILLIAVLSNISAIQRLKALAVSVETKQSKDNDNSNKNELDSVELNLDKNL